MGIEGLGSWDVSLMRILENLISGKMKRHGNRGYDRLSENTHAGEQGLMELICDSTNL